MVKVDSLVKLHALISLNNKEKNGYELMKEVEEKTNKKISASHIYPFLKELKEFKHKKLKNKGIQVFILPVEESF